MQFAWKAEMKVETAVIVGLHFLHVNTVRG